MAEKKSLKAIQIKTLQRLLGYQFNNLDLLHQALRHKSAGGAHNERLEFLGDSVVGYVAARLLYERFPEISEGELTRLRASVVKGTSLAKIGDSLGLSEVVIMGLSELKGGGFRRESTLADTFEAVIAAILLDSDFTITESVVAALFNPIIDNLPSAEQLKDPKTRLQEFWQSRKQPPPSYDLISTVGPDHAQVFTVKCFQGNESVEASGSSRRKAEQAAAATMLENLGVK
jgi:ribonuclease-3